VVPAVPAALHFRPSLRSLDDHPAAMNFNPTNPRSGLKQQLESHSINSSKTSIN
jgi:hypothetical protein